MCEKVYYALTKVSQIINDKDIEKKDKEVFSINWFLKEICTKPPHSALKARRTPAQGNREEVTRPSSK